MPQVKQNGCMMTVHKLMTYDPIDFDFLKAFKSPLPKIIGIWISYKDAIGQVFFDDENQHRTSDHLKWLEGHEPAWVASFCRQRVWEHKYLYDQSQEST